MTEATIGQMAPLFSLPDLAGRPAALTDFRGRIVLLNFWSCECPWAERADRALRFKLAQWRAQVAWVSIAANANESPAQLRAVAEERELPLVLHDATGQTVDAYAALTTPHIFLIDARGLLRYRGGLDDTSFRQRTPTRVYAFEALEALLKDEQPPVVETNPYGCTIVRFRAEPD